MTQLKPFPFGSVLFACLVAACSTSVPPGVIAWSERAPVVAPPATAAVGAQGSDGYLRVETDTDVRASGSLSYDNVRRSFDLYAADGTSIRRDIDNRGGRYGEEPVSLPLPPGRYVVASTYGSTYRKVQVEIRAGATTGVTADTLREAAPVFAP